MILFTRKWGADPTIKDVLTFLKKGDHMGIKSLVVLSVACLAFAFAGEVFGGMYKLKYQIGCFAISLACFWAIAYDIAKGKK